MERLAARVLLIDWVDADWSGVSPLLDAGRLPHLAAVIEGGVCGNLAMPLPAISPLLRASIVTGKRPHKHGILVGEQADSGAAPAACGGRRTKALWNILAHRGLASVVVGWCDSSEAEPIRGAMLTGVGSARIEAAAREMMAREAWDLALVRFDARRPRDGEGAGDISVEEWYAIHDAILGRLVKAAATDTCVMVIGDRSSERRTAPGGGDAPRPGGSPSFGIIAMSGGGMRRDERLYGASLLDVCPTILRILGLPVGADMDGRVLVDAFASPPEVATIPSWDDVPGDCGFRADLRPIVPPHASDPPTERARAWERQFNMARSLLDAGRDAEAIAILEAVRAAFPQDRQTAILLVHGLRSLGRRDDARRVIADAAPLLDSWEISFLTGMLLIEEGRHYEALPHLVACRDADPGRADLHVALARAESGMGRHGDAESSCRRALVIEPQLHAALALLAEVHFVRQEYLASADVARRALGVRYFDPRMHALAGTALAAAGRPHEAIAALRVAVRQNPDFPAAYERLAAVHARQLADFASADDYRRRGREAAARIGGVVPSSSPPAPEPPAHVPPARPAAGPPGERIVIVTGLPRSGTSMLMQMLAAGGVPALTDASRAADENNPHGYLEHEAVKRLASDASWLAAARGKALKVVAPLVPALPPGHDYRVIHVRRDMAEVLASQRSMLGRIGATGTNAAADVLAREFARHLAAMEAWLTARGVALLGVDHRECVSGPEQVAERIAGFLDLPLDTAAMAAAVDLRLWRERT